MQSYPCNSKTSLRQRRIHESFSSRVKRRKSFTLTIRWNFGKSREDLSWNHRTSTTRRSETNGIAERAVRRTKEGRSAVLLRSGLDQKWVADSTECCCFSLADGKTLYERRFEEPLKGPIILFGAMVEYHPISTRDLSRLHQIGKKVLPGIFLGYGLIAWRFWKGDILIADWEDLEKLDASEMYRYSHSQMVRQNCQEGTMKSKKPLQDGNKPRSFQ